MTAKHAKTGRQIRKAAASEQPPAAVTTESKDPNEVRVGKLSTPDMRVIGGSDFEHWNQNLLHRTYSAMSPGRHAGEPDEHAVQRRNAATAGLGLRAFQPKDEVESMLAAQAVMLHAMAMECGRKAMIREQHPDVASKLRKDACNAARSMMEMTEALQRRRGKGAKQVVRVERVQVAPGGQVAVGNFAHGGALPLQDGGPTPLEPPKATDVALGEERDHVLNHAV